MSDLINDNLMPLPGVRIPPSTSGGTPDATAPDTTANHLVAGLHFRGKLPHLKREGAVYFVTFRLADSLPASAFARLKQERSIILEQARAAKKPLTWHEEEQLLAWYCEKVEIMLDGGLGSCWLSNPNIGNMVAGALKFFEGTRYDLCAWVLMPNHVHVVVWPYPGYNLSQILHSWKSYTSKRANKILGGVVKNFWQPESFDHIVRNDEERVRIIGYVEENPRKAGLCLRSEDWQWSSAFERGVTSPD